MKVHGKTGAHTTEQGHHNGESVHDVRASPTDEGGDDAEEDDPCRAARRPGTGANGSPPWSSRTTRSLRQNCGHRAPRGYPTDLLLRVRWVHFVPAKKRIKKCHRVNPGPGENEPQKPPPSHDDTSDEVPKLWSERGPPGRPKEHHGRETARIDGMHSRWSCVHTRGEEGRRAGVTRGHRTKGKIKHARCGARIRTHPQDDTAERRPLPFLTGRGRATSHHEVHRASQRRLIIGH